MYDEKANRQYYLERGRCPYCSGKNAVTPGYKTCTACRERRRNNEKNRRERHKEAGTCIRCGAPIDGKHKQCQKCRDYYNENFGALRAILLKHRRNTLRDAGKCIRCGVRFAEPGRSQCRKCLDKQKIEQKKSDPNNERHNAMRNAWRAKGLCWDCGRPTVNGASRCSACAERQRDSNRKYAILKRMDMEAADARRGIYRAN